MRKDVKFGMAVAVILLAVVVVYVTVIRPSKPRSTGSEVVSTDGSASDEPAPLPDNAPATEPAVASPASLTSAVTPAPPAADMWVPLLTHSTVLTSTPIAGSGAKPAMDAPATMPSSSVGDAAVPASARIDTPADPATRPSASSTFTVRPGDNYSIISKFVYKTPRYFKAIQEANPSIDPHRLKPGMTINLPNIDVAGASAAPAVSSASVAAPAVAETPAADSARQYRVVSGDSLHKISMKLFGRADMVQKIYDLNRQTIGPDLGKLKVGMVLQVPPAPSAQ